jgi:hypothetical protein
VNDLDNMPHNIGLFMLVSLVIFWRIHCNQMIGAHIPCMFSKGLARTKEHIKRPGGNICFQSWWMKRKRLDILGLVQLGPFAMPWQGDVQPLQVGTEEAITSSQRLPPPPGSWRNMQSSQSHSGAPASKSP